MCESTGGYERLVLDRLHKTEIRIHLAQPTLVRAFARACGFQAKTAPRDAQVLSRFGSVFQEHDAGITMPEPELEELRDLLRRRRQLVEQRVQELRRVYKVVSLAVAEPTNRHIGWLEAEIEQLDREYQEKVQNSPYLAQRAALYGAVPSVGVLTAAILIAHLPELGLLDAKPLASLVGVAPRSRDSGQSGVSGPFEEVAAWSAGLCTSVPGQWSGGWLIAPLLSETAPAWKAWEGRSGSSDAEVVAAAERRGR